MRKLIAELNPLSSSFFRSGFFLLTDVSRTGFCVPGNYSVRLYTHTYILTTMHSPLISLSYHRKGFDSHRTVTTSEQENQQFVATTNCINSVPLVHSGGKPPASYAEGELRREKFPACQQLQACKWKEKVAAFGRNTCRFLPRIARKGALPITHPEEILAVIPNYLNLAQSSGSMLPKERDLPKGG
jgi:hypothetical protein